jgi:hypothetical protein
MKIIQNREYALASTDVRGINNREMRQMNELKEKIGKILENHKVSDEDLKKSKSSRIYASDDELKLMFAILSVFTNEFSNTQVSAFDDFMKEQDKPVEQQQDKIEDEPLIDPYRD